MPATDLWQENQNYLTKVNFKVAASNLATLYLRFDLKELYNQNPTDSGFRVLVNGVDVSGVLYPSASKQSGFQTFQFNLTPYVGANMYVSLQHIGKTATDIAYLRNVQLTQTSTLSAADFDLAGIKAYPNPTRDALNIEAASLIRKIEVCNISGQIINTLDVNNTATKVDLSGFSNGVYFVTVFAEGQNKTLKIIKL